MGPTHICALEHIKQRISRGKASKSLLVRDDCPPQFLLGPGGGGNTCAHVGMDKLAAEAMWEVAESVGFGGV